MSEKLTVIDEAGKEVDVSPYELWQYGPDVLGGKIVTLSPEQYQEWQQGDDNE